VTVVRHKVVIFHHNETLRAFPSEFLEKPNMNLNIQKFKVQVRKMWFRVKRECQRSVLEKKEKKKKGM
jgi:hypothetical protein